MMSRRCSPTRKRRGSVGVSDGEMPTLVVGGVRVWCLRM